ncbi:ATP-binding protein [Burkholderia cepacia]|uniref:AAA family ATPase n=1 Tax=Burkholderia cepacia TaxID=292 RepID=UPI002FE1B5B1
MQTKSLHATASDDAVLLHMVCGKIASGKSTLVARLASAGPVVAISEDAWLAHLYPDEILSIDDYVRCARRVGNVIADQACAVLQAGVSVVLDVPFNTVAARAWGLAVSQAAGCGHRLHTSTSAMRSARRGCARATREATIRSRRRKPSSTG